MIRSALFLAPSLFAQQSGPQPLTGPDEHFGFFTRYDFQLMANVLSGDNGKQFRWDTHAYGSAVWGILFALLQDDLKRVLAYSTVENIGLILIGIGGAIAARTQGGTGAVQLGVESLLAERLA